MRYFFYGTLLDEGVRRRVLGIAPLRERTAWLSGYARVGMPGKSYPTLVDAMQSVTGGLFEGITVRQRRRIIAFEGVEYREAILPVRVETGAEIPARVFLPRRPPKVTIPWSYERWQRIDRARFLRALNADGLLSATKSV